MATDEEKVGAINELIYDHMQHGGIPWERTLQNIEDVIHPTDDLHLAEPIMHDAVVLIGGKIPAHVPGAYPTLMCCGGDIKLVPLDDEVEAMIADADHSILLAQYRELHNRLEDYTTWLIEMNFLAKNAIAGPNGIPSRTSDYGDFLFEHIEAYLDQANEHEDRGPLDQILHPDMEGAGEPD